MNTKDYICYIPQYVYSTTTLVHPLIELFRLKIINEYMTKIKMIIDKRLVHTRMSTRKINQYFSQLIMNVITEKTYTTKTIVHLDDGLINIPIGDEIDDFYRDVNKFIGDHVSNASLFVSDEFGVVPELKSMVQQIKEFSQSVDINEDVFIFDGLRFIIKKETLIKYKMESLTKLVSDIVVDMEILEKNKKVFSGPPDKFELYLLCVMLRYLAFGSGANQFVVDIEYKVKLRKFGFNFECFASPLNRFYDNFCSAFYDIEQYFKSFGSFMALKMVKGNYMTNPPYDSNLMYKMYYKVKTAILESDDVNCIMSIPKWADFDLEKEIDMDKLFYLRKVKFEYYLDPLTKNEILIPPYVSYLFYGKNTKPIPALNDLFLNFVNYTLNLPELDKKLTYYVLDLFRSLTYSKMQRKNEGDIIKLFLDDEKAKYYVIGNIFMNECMKECDENGSMIKYFNENMAEITDTIKRKRLDFNNITIREVVYVKSATCYLHNPIFVKYFINRYGCTSVLDVNMLWGDQLVGTMATKVVRYYGISKDKCISDNYKKLYSTLITKSPNPQMSIEVGNSPTGTYDMVYYLLTDSTIFDLNYTKFLSEKGVIVVYGNISKTVYSAITNENFKLINKFTIIDPENKKDAIAFAYSRK